MALSIFGTSIPSLNSMDSPRKKLVHSPQYAFRLMVRNYL